MAEDRRVINLTFVRHPRPGDVLRGEIRIPEGPPPRSAVIVVHGFKGFKDWCFFPFLCDTLAAAGHAVVSFNFSRNGVGADLVSFSELDSFGSNTLSFEQEELRLVLGEVIDGDLLPKRPERIGLLGHSRGGGQSVLAAGREPRLSALVTWGAVSYFDRWSDETKETWREDGRVWVLNKRTGQSMPLDLRLLEDYEAHADELDVASAAARIEAPWLIVHGVDDVTVFPSDARMLAEAAPAGKLALIEGAGHTFEARHPFEHSTPQLDDAVGRTVAHFGRHLKP